jgi:hypothetical protein
MHVYCVCIYRPLDIRDMTAANALLLTLYKNAWKGGREVTGRSIHDDVSFKLG